MSLLEVLSLLSSRSTTANLPLPRETASPILSVFAVPLPVISSRRYRYSPVTCLVTMLNSRILRLREPLEVVSPALSGLSIAL